MRRGLRQAGRKGVAGMKERCRKEGEVWLRQAGGSGVAEEEALAEWLRQAGERRVGRMAEMGSGGDIEGKGSSMADRKVQMRWAGGVEPAVWLR